MLMESPLNKCNNARFSCRYCQYRSQITGLCKQQHKVVSPQWGCNLFTERIEKKRYYRSETVIIPTTRSPDPVWDELDGVFGSGNTSVTVSETNSDISLDDFISLESVTVHNDTILSDIVEELNTDNMCNGVELFGDEPYPVKIRKHKDFLRRQTDNVDPDEINKMGSIYIDNPRKRGKLTQHEFSLKNINALIEDFDAFDYIRIGCEKDGKRLGYKPGDIIFTPDIPMDQMFKDIIGFAESHGLRLPEEYDREVYLGNPKISMVLYLSVNWLNRRYYNANRNNKSKFGFDRDYNFGYFPKEMIR